MSQLAEIPETERIKPARLTPQRRAFVRHYIKTSNATLAAKRAGYSELNAQEQGSYLLSLPEIQRSIDAVMQKLDIKAESVLQETAKLAFSNIANYLTLDAEGFPRIDFTETTYPQFAAVQEISEDVTGGSGDGERRQVLRRKIKLQPKVQALEILADHLHLRDKRVEVDIGENLASRLGGARHRTLDATPDAAQVLIDTHTQEHVLTSNDMNALTEAESTMSTGTEKTISDPTPGGVAPAIHQIPQAIFAKLEDAGIVKPVQPESPAGLARLGMIAGDGEQAE